MLQPGEMLADKYRIKGVIGEGSFGRVYRAEGVALGRDVAIKELLKGEGELGSSDYAQFSERFRREARVQAQFNHPNIVHVYELLEPEPGTMYLVMEYVDGPSLRDYLADNGPLPVGEALRIARAILEGLVEVHNHAWAIVHRDVKPSNILLTAQREPKLADFGLAQVLDESMRSGGGEPHPGTQAYMSPEQAETTAYLYPPSDLFSLGCVLFEMLSGVPYRQAQHRGKSLSDLRPDVPAWLEKVVAKSLAEDSAGRHQTAEEFSAALDAGAKGRPDQAGRPAWLTPVALGAAGVALLALIVLAVGGVLLAPVLTSPPPAPNSTAAAVPSGTAFRGSAIHTPTATPVPAGPAAGERWTRPADGMEMVYVPPGEFLMGSPDGEGEDEEHPQHTVSLDAFWIDRYEVTNDQYRAFVEATGNRVPYDWQKGEIPAGKQDHPVVRVSWEDAQAYCQWAGARLPTEAEWEKGARGTDARQYPWGNTFDGSRLNFCDRNCEFDWKDTDVDDGYARTAPVGSFPAGASPYGALDMAGNVWEWVADWYDGDYYRRSPGSNPAGPDSGGYRVLRGGSWSSYPGRARSAYRDWIGPGCTLWDFGFRCCVS